MPNFGLSLWSYVIEGGTCGGISIKERCGGWREVFYGMVGVDLRIVRGMVSC